MPAVILRAWISVRLALQILLQMPRSLHRFPWPTAATIVQGEDRQRAFHASPVRRFVRPALPDFDNNLVVLPGYLKWSWLFSREHVPLPSWVKPLANRLFREQRPCSADVRGEDFAAKYGPIRLNFLSDISLYTELCRLRLRKASAVFPVIEAEDPGGRSAHDYHRFF